MSFNDKCQQIREIKSHDEELAFQRLHDILREYMNEYTCDNEFYLYACDQSNNYHTFRENTELIFALLYDMFYDEEQIKEVSKDPSVKDELAKFWKFIESVQFIRKHIRTICFEEDSVEVRCFDKYMNYCKKYLTEIYDDMKDLNDTLNEMNTNIKALAEQLVQLSTQN